MAETRRNSGIDTAEHCRRPGRTVIDTHRNKSGDKEEGCPSKGAGDWKGQGSVAVAVAVGDR